MIATAARQRAAVIGVGAAAVGAAAVLAIGDPNRGGFPQCPFHRVTGLWCPGCGTQRALHALAHLDIVHAFHENALAMCALPFLVYAYVAWCTRAFAIEGVPRLRHPAAPVWLTSALPAVVIGFAVLRNLPFGRVLGP